MTLPPQDPYAAHIRGLADSARQLTQSAMRERSVDRTVKLIRKIQVISNSEMDRFEREAAGHGIELACAIGCAHCCYQVAAALAVEVIALAAYVRENFSPEHLKALRTRLSHYRAELLKTPAGERARTACPMLVDEKCSVHPARPETCRACNSRDVSVCIFEREHPGEPPPAKALIPIFETAFYMLSGVGAALNRASLDSAMLCLPLALEIALNIPHAAERYLAGEDIFRAAKMDNDDLTLKDILTRGGAKISFGAP